MELDQHTKSALLQEHQRLKKLNQNAEAETESKPESTILNQSLQEILGHISQAVTGFMNDLLEPTFQWTNLREILTKDERMVYLGLFVVVMTIIAMLLKND